MNDVYRPDTPSGPLVLMLYRTGHDSAGWEVALAASFHSPVAATPQWPAFRAGHREVRRFGAADEAALPWLVRSARGSGGR